MNFEKLLNKDVYNVMRVIKNNMDNHKFLRKSDIQAKLDFPLGKANYLVDLMEENDVVFRKKMPLYNQKRIYLTKKGLYILEHLRKIYQLEEKISNVHPELIE